MSEITAERSGVTHGRDHVSRTVMGSGHPVLDSAGGPRSVSRHRSPATFLLVRLPHSRARSKSAGSPRMMESGPCRARAWADQAASTQATSALNARKTRASRRRDTHGAAQRRPPRRRPDMLVRKVRLHPPRAQGRPRPSRSPHHTTPHGRGHRAIDDHLERPTVFEGRRRHNLRLAVG